MPVLRLQQPRPPCRHRRGALRARLRRRDRRDRRARARTDRLHHLLRRRHAVADAARDRRRDSRRDRAALDGRARRRGDARSQPDQRRGDALSRLSARPASIASRSACRRSTMPRSSSSGASTSADEALAAVAVARANFERYSFDLIYARPGQTPEAWAAELKRALAQAGEHLSLYQLTIEQDTPFAALHAAGKLVMPDEDLGARALRYDAGGLRGRRPARLRDLQPRAAGRRMPAQSRLLARARICRHRAGRARPARYRIRAPRHRDREAAGGLADARRRRSDTGSTPTSRSRASRWRTSSC